ncbi:MAG: SpoIIE family protein phosphatase, partial [Simkaniaceae bacterium]|nr:SpoIIE family protein phosphatase [Simkaniaceae bacterium]
KERIEVVRHHLGRAIEVFAFVVVIGGIIGLVLTFRMGRPYKKLGDVMGRVEDGDLDLRYAKDRWGFEVNQLGMACNGMIESLLRHADEMQEERLKSEALSKELIMGGNAQQAVAPREIIEFPELAIETGYISAKEVGGDFYDLISLDDTQLFIVVGDAAGKGLFAGFFSLTLRGILRGLVKKERDLSVIVKEANELFCADTKDSGVFITAWFGIYDREKKLLQYVSCGHPPAFLGEQKLDAGGMALGIATFEHVDVKEKSIENGATLVVYTDGITEAHNHDNEMYGEERLANQVGAGGDVVENVLRDVTDFEAGRPRFDDQTIIQITF